MVSCATERLKTSSCSTSIGSAARVFFSFILLSATGYSNVCIWDHMKQMRAT